MITCPLCNEIYKIFEYDPDVFLHKCIFYLNNKIYQIESSLNFDESCFFTISAEMDDFKKIILQFDGYDFTIFNYKYISHKHDIIVLSRKIIPFSSFLHDKNHITYLYNMFLKTFKISYML